jgi:hypothetical protein
MRSESIAAAPHSAYSYTWKVAVPSLRPALLNQCSPEADKVEHTYVSWKTYLAAREFQSLAADLADGFFSQKADAALSPMDRPSILRSETLRAAGGKPLSCLLIPAVQSDADVAARELPQGSHSCDLAKAA